MTASTYQDHTVTSDKQHIHTSLLDLHSKRTKEVVANELTLDGRGCPSSLISTVCIDSSAPPRTKFMCASYAYDIKSVYFVALCNCDHSHEAVQQLSCLPLV
jgi:hypothetical protein